MGAKNLLSEEEEGLIKKFEEQMVLCKITSNLYRVQSSLAAEKLKKIPNAITKIALYLDKKYNKAQLAGQLKKDYEALFITIASFSRLKDNPGPTANLDQWRTYAYSST